MSTQRLFKPALKMKKTKKKYDLFEVLFFSHIDVRVWVYPNFAFLLPVRHFGMWQAGVFHKHCLSGQRKQKRQLDGTVVAWHIKLSFNLLLSILHLKKNANVYSHIKDAVGSQIMTTNYIPDVRFLAAANDSLTVYKTSTRFGLGKLTVVKSYPFFPKSSF